MCARAVAVIMSQTLDNPALAEALTRKTEFTQQECKSFGVHKLRHDDSVRAGGSYFRPTQVTDGPSRRFSGSTHPDFLKRERERFLGTPPVPSDSEFHELHEGSISYSVSDTASELYGAPTAPSSRTPHAFNADDSISLKGPIKYKNERALLFDNATGQWLPKELNREEPSWWREVEEEEEEV